MTYEELKQELQDCSREDLIYYLYVKSIQLETARKDGKTIKELYSKYF